MTDSRRSVKIEYAPTYLAVARRAAEFTLKMAKPQVVAFGQREIAAGQIGHRALLEPLPVETPFTPRADQSIGTQRLEHEISPDAFAIGRQSFKPRTGRDRVSRRAGRPSKRHRTLVVCAVPDRRAGYARCFPQVWRDPLVGINATVCGCGVPSSKISIALRHASRWLSITRFRSAPSLVLPGGRRAVNLRVLWFAEIKDMPADTPPTGHAFL